MEWITQYFPDLSEHQLEQYARMLPLYKEWNEKINVISRKDIDALNLHHVLHSLAIAKVIRFRPGAQVMDVGTGGGFPGIPLAIFFPETEFLLVDSIGKKIRVAEEIAKELGLENVRVRHARVEDVREKFDFIVSRAVTAFSTFVPWVQNKIRTQCNHSLPNGVLYLKGGDFDEEIRLYRKRVVIYPISDYFGEEYFETKKVIYLPF